MGFAALLLAVLAPLAVFVGPLARARALGRLRYGALASHHGRLFEERWLGSDEPPGEAILEAPDISSLADVQGGFERVYRIRLSEILKKLLGAST